MFSKIILNLNALSPSKCYNTDNILMTLLKILFAEAGPFVIYYGI